MGKIKIALCSLILLSFFILSFLNPSSALAQDSHCTQVGDECCGPPGDLYCDLGLSCNEETERCEGDPVAHCGSDGEICCTISEKGYECAGGMSTCVAGVCQPNQGPEIPLPPQAIVGPEECIVNLKETPGGQFISGDPGIQTAIGCVPYDPGNLVKWLLGFGLSLAGGIAFLLMTWGAFLYITSQGNPDQLQKAEETIVSAVGGLLFIIFAVFLLRLIGVDILKIPGFQ